MELAALAPNIVVKVPVMPEGLAATKALYDTGIKVNATLCFSVPQALLVGTGRRLATSARSSGASTTSPRTASSTSATPSTRSRNYDFGHDVEVIAASIRSANHVVQAALIGADIATVPFAVLKNLVKHPLTDRGLESFLADWEKVKNS